MGGRWPVAVARRGSVSLHCHVSARVWGRAWLGATGGRDLGTAEAGLSGSTQRDCRCVRHPCAKRRPLQPPCSAAGSWDNPNGLGRRADE